MRKFLGFASVCLFFFAGAIFLSVDGSQIRSLQNYLSRAAFDAAEISTDYGDIQRINSTAPPAREKFCLGDSSIPLGKFAPSIWFDPNLKGGAHTWVFNGAEVIKGLTAYCGDPRLDTELLAQIRDLLDPAKGPTATGGYQDQKQLGTAFMFFLAKRTPEIWSHLSPAEQSLVDLSMEAFMYSSTFTTKDRVAGYLGMDGDTNLNRDWNPNYQNGMVGMIIVTALYWGFDEFESKLATYDDESFLSRLRANNMKNLVWTYANPARPAGATIQAGLRKRLSGSVYRFHDITERSVAGLFNYIASRTFSATISCGLNNGAGIAGFGRVVNCNLLPNTGRKGMMLEFAGRDAEGQRSSALYDWDAWYPLNYARAAMQITGWLTPSALTQSTTFAETMNRYAIGSNDLWFKILPEKGGGYLDYEHGEQGGLIVLDSTFDRDHGAAANLDLFNMLQRNLGLDPIKE
jgi:hypothetical protein